MTRALALVIAVFQTGCEDRTSATPTPADPQPAATHAEAELPATPMFTVCDPPALSEDGQGFRHKRSSAMALGMSAEHFMQDVIGKPGTSEAVAAKFAYGEISKDLEDEPITAWLGDCDGWHKHGAAVTDDDGRATIDAKLPGVPGRYRAAATADGDGSAAVATLTAIPEGTQLIVFDIDGTLTVDDAEVTKGVVDDHFDAMYKGDYDPEPYAGAAQATMSWHKRGYVLVYLTGRPYWLIDTTRDWLAHRGFAPGHVHTTDRHRDVLPNVDGVGRFKAGYLKSLVALGYKIEHVYGNATTDVWAYAEAGIPTELTHIIGPHAGDGATQSVGADYVKHVVWINERAPANQPFGFSK